MTLLQKAKALWASLDGNNHPLPLKYRAGLMVLAAVLALSLLQLWAGGVRFMKLVSHVAQTIADQEMAKAPPPPPPAPPPVKETPGVVSVGILPDPKSGAAP